MLLMLAGERALGADVGGITRLLVEIRSIVARAAEGVGDGERHLAGEAAVHEEREAVVARARRAFETKYIAPRTI